MRNIENLSKTEFFQISELVYWDLEIYERQNEEINFSHDNFKSFEIYATLKTWEKIKIALKKQISKHEAKLEKFGPNWAMAELSQDLLKLRKNLLSRIPEISPIDEARNSLLTVLNKKQKLISNYWRNIRGKSSYLIDLIGDKHCFEISEINKEIDDLVSYLRLLGWTGVFTNPSSIFDYLFKINELGGKKENFYACKYS